MQTRHNLTLSLKDEGQFRDPSILFTFIIYTKVVELVLKIMHTKYLDHWTLGSGEDFSTVFIMYEHGGHLGHVTKTILINFIPFPRRPRTKLKLSFG